MGQEQHREIGLYIIKTLNQGQWLLTSGFLVHEKNKILLV